MARLVEAVWVRSDCEWSAVQHSAICEACRKYLRWRHPNEEPTAHKVEAFLKKAKESSVSICWWVIGENSTGPQSEMLLDLMRRHCEPTGLLVSGHLSC